MFLGKENTRGEHFPMSILWFVIIIFVNNIDNRIARVESNVNDIQLLGEGILLATPPFLRPPTIFKNIGMFLPQLIHITFGHVHSTICGHLLVQNSWTATRQVSWKKLRDFLTPNKQFLGHVLKGHHSLTENFAWYLILHHFWVILVFKPAPKIHRIIVHRQIIKYFVFPYLRPHVEPMGSLSKISPYQHNGARPVLPSTTVRESL